MINFSDAFEENEKKNEECLSQDGNKNSGGLNFSALNKRKEETDSNQSNMIREKLGSKEGEGAEAENSKILNIDAKSLYLDAIALAQDIFEKRDNLRSLDIKNISQIVEKFINRLDASEQFLLEYLFVDPPDKATYISVNAVNTTILSLEVAYAFNYTKEQLNNLGIAAFLHKIGLRRFSHLTSQPRQLTKEEKNEIHKYPLVSLDIVRATEENIDSMIVSIIEQHHERFDGSGYPRGLKNSDINEAAQIVGLSDVYEVLIHKRPYRDKFFLLDAFKLIVKNKIQFNPRVMKAFLERIGIYPKGATVELNTKEVAKVIKQNYRMPLSPVVKVLNNNQDRAENNKEIDLSRGARIYITKAL